MTFIEGFRRFTRIPEPQREPFEVRELIRQAVVLTAAEKDGVRIRTDIEPADTMIYADKAQLGQVTVNLLKTPARRSPDGATARSRSARASMRRSTSSSRSATTAERFPPR